MVCFFWAPSASRKGQNGLLPGSLADEDLHCGAVQALLSSQNLFHDLIQKYM